MPKGTGEEKLKLLQMVRPKLMTSKPPKYKKKPHLFVLWKEMNL